jgi:hypothetical protein
VWGGDGPFEFERDGAALDPRRNRWRGLPASPLRGRGGHAAVWTGRELLVVGGASNLRLGGWGAAYSPSRRTWRLVPRPPGGTSFGAAAVWIGTGLLVLDRGVRPLLWRRDAGWSRLGLAPHRRRGEFAWAWTGTKLVVWGGEAAPDDDYLADGAILTP